MTEHSRIRCLWTLPAIYQVTWHHTTKNVIWVLATMRTSNLTGTLMLKDDRKVLFNDLKTVTIGDCRSLACHESNPQHNYMDGTQISLYLHIYSMLHSASLELIYHKPLLLYLFHLLCMNWVTDTNLRFQLPTDWLATIHKLQKKRLVSALLGSVQRLRYELDVQGIVV